MQTHDLDKGKGGTYFGLGRPEREIIGALHGLTGAEFRRRRAVQHESQRRSTAAGPAAPHLRSTGAALAGVVGGELAEPHRRCRVSKGQSERRRRAAAPRPSGSGEDGPTQRRNERGRSLSGDPGRPARLALLRSRYRLSAELAGPHSQSRGLPRCEGTGGVGVPKRRRSDVHHPSFAGRNRDLRVAGAGDEGPGDQTRGTCETSTR